MARTTSYIGLVQGPFEIIIKRRPDGAEKKQTEVVSKRLRHPCQNDPCHECSLSLSPGEKADCDAPSANPYEDFDLQGLFQERTKSRITSPHLLLERALMGTLTGVKVWWIGVINPDQNGLY